MKRNAINDLIQWKPSEDRKPMVLKGARQVGKTWLMKEFGQSCYQHTVYFNFDKEDELKSIFETNKSPQRIIELLSMVAGERYIAEHRRPHALRFSKRGYRKDGHITNLPLYLSRKPLELL